MTRCPVLAATTAALLTALAPSQSDTAEMLRELGRLEPRQGWIATPPGVAEEQWSYYQRTFGMAPDGNEPDATRAGLGQLLFFDKRLSKDGTRSCASCHDPRYGFAEQLPTSLGVDGHRAPRNAPTLMNAALQKRLFWDGRAQTLEEQAAAPILNPHEMGMPDEASVVARVRRRLAPGEQHERYEDRGRFDVVREGDLRFRVNLTDYLDTGLFLDDRLLRRLVRERAAGRDVLNVFSYTCAISVAAATISRARLSSQKNGRDLRHEKYSIGRIASLYGDVFHASEKASLRQRPNPCAQLQLLSALRRHNQVGGSRSSHCSRFTTSTSSSAANRSSA